MIREKYIAELSKQPIYNNGIEHSKINIHFPINGEINKYIQLTNKKICEITNSEVDFSPITFQLPHITLAMGYVKNSADFLGLCLVLEEFVNDLKSLALSFTKPYIKKPSNKYVFVDVIQIDEVIALKKKLNKIIEPYFETVKWDILNEPPHITVGYIQSKRKEVENSFKELPKIVFQTDKINISLTGKRGSVIGTLREFRINNC